MVRFVGEMVCIKLIRDPPGPAIGQQRRCFRRKTTRIYGWVAKPIEKCASKQVHPYCTIVEGQGARTTGPRSKEEKQGGSKKTASEGWKRSVSTPKEFKAQHEEDEDERTQEKKKDEGVV